MRKPSEARSKFVYFAFLPSSLVKNKKIRHFLYTYVIIGGIIRGVIAGNKASKTVGFHYLPTTESHLNLINNATKFTDKAVDEEFLSMIAADKEGSI